MVLTFFVVIIEFAFFFPTYLTWQSLKLDLGIHFAELGNY